ncbi:hypothetical protein GY45DRAFT_1264444 [Cubamyces sp. BRFM 1775]|nr:hypothetical protein GY45DRAFT_1264444 [Cubamyces sp. BRFM 1775]
MLTIQPAYRRTSAVQQSNVRSHRERLRQEAAHWAAQLEQLADAYLLWKHELRLTITKINPTHPLQRDTATEDAVQGHTFEVTAVWTYDRIATYTVMQRDEELANVALLGQGLLGCSPLFPETVFSLDLLEFYHRLRRRHPRLGIQPFVRAVCDIQDVSFVAHFSAVFDAYLSILCCVERRCQVALGYDTKDWRMKNGCPACMLKLKDDPPLKPERLFAIDGNNSAKRVATAGREDPRVFNSEYFLPRHVVDRYKDEVKRKVHPRSKTAPDDTAVRHRFTPDSEPEDDAPWVTEEAPGEAPDGQDDPTPCTERWKASAAEHEKRALNIYETTGIFVCACRHGFIQLACEMVRSGELYV